jgi:hypothetical protein
MKPSSLTKEHGIFNELKPCQWLTDDSWIIDFFEEIIHAFITTFDELFLHPLQQK